MLVVPRGCGLGGDAGGEVDLGTAIDIEVGGRDQDHAVEVHLEALLHGGGEPSSPGGAIALADDEFWRGPAVLLVHVGMDEVAHRLNVGQLPVELVQIFALDHAAEAGADGIEINDIGGVENRLGIVFEPRRRLLLKAVVVVGHPPRAGVAHVHPHGCRARSAIEGNDEGAGTHIGDAALGVGHVEHLRDDLAFVTDGKPAGFGGVGDGLAVELPRVLRNRGFGG